MKKLILSIIFFLILVFLSHQKTNAQTDAECFKKYQTKEYECLQKNNKCIWGCDARDTVVHKNCLNSCFSQDKICSDQASSDLTACRAAIPQDNKNVQSEAKAKAESEQDCRKIFDKESYKCLGVSGDCQRECSEETKRPGGGTYFNSGEIYSKCTKASDCDGKGRACNEQTLANFRACQNAGKQPAASEVKQEDPKQDGVPVFIGEWFSRFSQAIDGLIALPGAFTDIVYEDKFYLAGDFPRLSEMSLEDFYQGNWYPNDDTPDREPNINVNDEQKSWEEFLPVYLPGKENITVIKGQGEIKSPASPQFIPVEPKGGDTVQVTYLDSTMRTASDDVQLRYTWSADSGTVINVSKWSEIKFREPVEVGGLTSHSVELGQGEMEIKVRNNKPAENQFGIDAGWLGVTVSRTHFWVSQSKDKKLAVIGVYEGEVEVKTRDGKTIKIKPDGNKPGVVVVSKKLSTVKLVFAGLVLAVIIGGVILILKRKFTAKSIKKKKK